MLQNIAEEVAQSDERDIGVGRRSERRNVRGPEIAKGNKVRLDRFAWVRCDELRSDCVDLLARRLPLLRVQVDVGLELSIHDTLGERTQEILLVLSLFHFRRPQILCVATCSVHIEIEDLLQFISQSDIRGLGHLASKKRAERHRVLCRLGLESGQVGLHGRALVEGVHLALREGHWL